MRDGHESIDSSVQDVMPVSHRRILVLMAILGVAGGIAGSIFESILFGIGIILGTAIAFGSYFWLKHSLKKVFETAEEGSKPKVSALRYLARYFTLGIVIAAIYISGIVPIIAVLLGMAGFGFAVVADGTIQIFTSFFNRKEL